MDRTDPSRLGKSKGIKAKRIILMDKNFFENFLSLKESLEYLPLPDMVIDFMEFTQKDIE